MTEMTGREHTVSVAVARAPKSNGSWINDARRFIAMHDALVAYDAAQKPADLRDSKREYIAEGRAAQAADAPDPVAVVREALKYAVGRSAFIPSMRLRDGVWHPGWEGDKDGVAGAAILNALSALLERAERSEQQRRDDNTKAFREGEIAGFVDGRRSGVIKGHETAAAMDQQVAANLRDRSATVYATQITAAELSADMHYREADRIRSGGAIDEGDTK